MLRKAPQPAARLVGLEDHECEHRSAAADRLQRDRPGELGGPPATVPIELLRVNEPVTLSGQGSRHLRWSII